PLSHSALTGQSHTSWCDADYFLTVSPYAPTTYKYTHTHTLLFAWMSLTRLQRIDRVKWTTLLKKQHEYCDHAWQHPCSFPRVNILSDNQRKLLYFVNNDQ